MPEPLQTNKQTNKQTKTVNFFLDFLLIANRLKKTSLTNIKNNLSLSLSCADVQMAKAKLNLQ
jgi:hypothetical protein